VLTVIIEEYKLYGPHPTEIDRMPSVVVFMAQMLFCMMVEDCMFYFTHRTLHHPWLYPYVHKIHHEN
jgi:sterol desaturase/sphingolipid hydroxylase (fatty acid hydroxylase superfamily)